MTHNRMLDRLPSVSITSKRNELKVYQGNVVYLNDGDNFELRFFNPTQEKIGVEINFNGIKKGDGYLVLNPGQDIILDRFLDEQRKMLFETYVVDGNNEDSVKAIEKNGIITFNFFKEYGSYVQDEVKINYNFPPKPHKFDYNNNNNNNYVKGMNGPSGTIGNLGHTGGNGFSTTTANNVNCTYTSPGVFVSQNDLSFSTLSNTIGMGSLSTSNMSFSAVIDNLETGRIEMGEVSNQKLKTVNANFCSTPIHSVTYQILPNSAMNRTVSEVRQYCPECGYRLRKETWNFCPKCGEDLK